MNVEARKNLLKLCLLCLPAVIVLSAYAVHRHYQANPSKTDLIKKWGNTYTELEQIDGNGEVQARDRIYPNGFFKLNDNMTYDRVSDGVPMTGTWLLKGKHLTLDAGGATERMFDIILLNSDSLIIQRNDGPTRYTQHYVVFNDHPRMVQSIMPTADTQLAVADD